MTGVTSTGFETPTFDEQLNEIVTEANTPEKFGAAFPTTPDSPAGILFNIITGALIDHYDITRSVASQGNRDEAEGKYLDDLAALNGIYRLTSAPSTGSLVFTAIDGTTIPVNTAVRFNTSSNVTLCSENTLITRTQCYKLKVTIPTATNGLSYTLRINNYQYSVTGNISSTVTTIRDALVSAINAVSVTQGVSAISDGSTSITVSLDEYRNGLTLNVITNLTLNNVSGIVKYQAASNGTLNFYAGQAVTLVNLVAGVASVANLVDWSVGREVETDAELRIRMDSKESTTGTATKPAIESSVSNLDGVLSTLIKENTTFSVDVDGRPPKSYELYVEGGDDDSIAVEIWRTKPAGISTFGGISKIIIDQNGDEQEVNFSRFETKYGWVRVTYQLDPEDAFPVNGDDLIRNTVVTTGNSFPRGQDLESTRFYGDLYNNVDGIVVVSVETAITSLPSDTPTYNTNRKSVDNTVKLLFDYTRTSTILQ